MKKSYFMVALGAIFFTQMQNMTAQTHSATVELNEWKGMPMPSAISDNGKFICGLEVMQDCYLWNTLNKDYFYAEGESSKSGSDLWDVTDDGVGVGSDAGTPSLFIHGQWSAVELPEGWAYAEINAVTPDGGRMAGSGMKGGYKSPIAWIGSKAYELQIPSEDYDGKEPQSVSAEKISADGTIITGFLRCNHGYFGAGIVWRNFGDDPSSVEPEVILLDQVTSEKLKYYSITAISPNGKWIAGGCGVVTPNSEKPGEFISVPSFYRYNLETNEIQVITDIKVDNGNGDGGVSGVDNDGRVFPFGEFQAADNPYTRQGYISVIGKATQKIEDYLKEEYNCPDLKDNMYYAGAVKSVSADGKTWVGMGCKLDEYGGFIYQEFLIKLDGGSLTGISDAKSDGTMKCFVNGKTLQLEGISHLEVISMDGSLLYGVSVNAGTVSLEQLPAGIYTVKMSDGKEVKAQKIVLGR